MMEEWRDIPGYEGIYQASNQGRIKSFHRNKETIVGKGKSVGYHSVNMCKDGKKKGEYVHKLIAMTWLPPYPYKNPYINHKDGNKLNNHPNNLEYGSQQENVLHAIETGLWTVLKPVIKLDLQTGEELEKFKSVSDARRRYSAVSRVLAGKGKQSGGYGWKYANNASTSRCN